MSRPVPAILPLPTEIQAQVKSAATITSLNDVILELLKNSLDAAARVIHIDVDYARGSCVVEDNGGGIPQDEFGENGALGLMHRR